MKRKGASIIFINSRDKILLFLRDDLPHIPFPNMWDIPGGHVEPGESPDVCIVREMNEEMGMTLTGFHYFRMFDFPDREEYIFWKKADLDIDAIDLTEGQCLKWFTHEEIRHTALPFGFNEVVERFFEHYPLSDDEALR